MAVNFESGQWLYSTDAEKVSHLQRKVLLFTMIAEELQTCKAKAKKMAKEAGEQLTEMMWDVDQTELERSSYWYAMYDYDVADKESLRLQRLTYGDREHVLNIAAMVARQMSMEGKRVIR